MCILTLLLLGLSFIFVKTRCPESIERIQNCECFEKIICSKTKNCTTKLPRHICLKKIVVSDVTYDIVIVSLSVLIGITIVCFTILSVKINSVELKIFKIKKNEKEYKMTRNGLSSDFNQVYERDNCDEKHTLEKEYYPKNKASVDLYKAYAATIENI